MRAISADRRADAKTRFKGGRDGRRAGRALTTLIVGGLLVLLFAAPAVAAGSSPQTDIPYDISPLLKNQPVPKQIKPGTAGGAAVTSTTPGAPDRPADIVLTLYDWDPANAGAYDVAFWKMASGTHSDVYVAWNDLTPPATSSQQDHAITETQLAYMAQEFDARIWESDVFHFGMYAPRGAKTAIGGSDGLRTAIFVYNIRAVSYTH